MDSSVAGTATSNPRRWARRAVTALVGALVITAMAWTLRDEDWSQLDMLWSPGDAATLSVGLIFSLTSVGLGMMSWRQLLLGMGTRISIGEAGRVYAAGMLVRYIPGRVWTLLANIKMGSAMGIPAKRMTAAYLLNTAILISTGMLCGLIAAPTVMGKGGLWLLPATAVVVVVVLWPGVINAVVRGCLRVFGRGGSRASVSPGSVRRAVGLQCLSWISGGVQLWLVAMAAGAEPAGSFLICVGTFGLAMVIGALVVVVPDGLGIREGILMLALSLVLPLPAATVVAVAGRLLCILADLGAAAAMTIAGNRVRRGRAGDSIVEKPAVTVKASR